MAHGIETIRDFVYSNTEERDWHKLTQHRKGLDPAKHFPAFKEVPTFYNGKDTTAQLPTGESVLVSTDDWQVCGKTFSDSFGYILPQRAWEMVSEALNGTHYTVERIGMLWSRSFWFVSIQLDELKELARKGESFNLNFSGSLKGVESPQGELASLRAVCFNTISISRATGKKLFCIKQTRNSGQRLDRAKADVEQAVGMAEVFNRAMKSIESKKVSADTARQLYVGEAVNAGAQLTREAIVDGAIARVENKKTANRIDSLMAAFQRGDGNEGKTRADVLNGFTQVFTRGTEESTKSAWQAVGSSEFGGNADRKANFFAAMTDETRYDELLTIGKTALAN